MRSNLVFTGLDELNSESYDTTKDLMVKTISERLNVPSASDLKLFEPIVADLIVRKRGPRPIFVKSDREDTAQKYLQEIIKIRTKQSHENSENQLNFSGDQQFTKELLTRRSNALLLRKELLSTKKITKRIY